MLLTSHLYEALSEEKHSVIAVFELPCSHRFGEESISKILEGGSCKLGEEGNPIQLCSPASFRITRSVACGDRALQLGITE